MPPLRGLVRTAFRCELSRSLFFRPFGIESLFVSTQGLRPGLYSFAASRLNLGGAGLPGLHCKPSLAGLCPCGTSAAKAGQETASNAALAALLHPQPIAITTD